MFQEAKVENVTVDSVVRLGKKAADPTQNPRPMNAVLDSVESKVSLLKKAKKLEGKGGGRTVKGIHTLEPGAGPEHYKRASIKRFFIRSIDRATVNIVAIVTQQFLTAVSYSIVVNSGRSGFTAVLLCVVC